MPLTLLFQIAVDIPETEADVIEILQFLVQQITTNQIFNMSELIISFLPSLSLFNRWATIVRNLYEKADLNNMETPHKTEEAIISVIVDSINKLGTESLVSLDTNINLVMGILTLVSCRPFFHQKIVNFSVLLDTVENLLKSRLPADTRLVLMKGASILTDICSLSSWSGTKTCYSLACIELKLILEEVVHKFEESQTLEISDTCIEGVIGCCVTIENSINEMVDENAQTPGETLQKLIDDIRMAMSSAMFYLQKTELVEQVIFVPVLRCFMRWLSDDSSCIQDIINTFSSLKTFYENEQNYISYGSFIVSAILFQMEDQVFRTYVKDDLGYFLLHVGVRSFSKYALIVAPIFNDLLSYDIFLNTNKIIERTCFSELVSQLLSFDESEFSFRGLSLIQFCSYVILCFSKRNININTVHEPWDLSQWVTRTINYLLVPFIQEESDQSWVELKEVWFSSVYSVCQLLEKIDEGVCFEQVNMRLLVSRSSNYSELGDEVSGALEELLALVAT